MRPHKIPALPSRLFELDNFHGPFAWLSDAAIIAVSITVAKHWIFLYPLAVLIIGARQRALATLLHEASHLTLTRNPSLNYVLGTWASAYLIFQTWDAYRRSHIRDHHGKFGSDDDPDFAFHREIGLYDTFGLRQVFRGFIRYVRYLVVNRLIPLHAKKSELLKMLSLWCALVYFADIGDVAAYWLVPMVLSFGPIGYLIEIGEHWPLMRSDCPLYQTRNRSSSCMEYWIFSIHSENYHLVHHLYPRLPFKSMAKADAYLISVWPEYHAWSKENGGIFLSGNGAPSVVSQLIKASKQRTDK